MWRHHKNAVGWGRCKPSTPEYRLLYFIIFRPVQRLTLWQIVWANIYWRFVNLTCTSSSIHHTAVWLMSGYKSLSSYHSWWCWAVVASGLCCREQSLIISYQCLKQRLNCVWVLYTGSSGLNIVMLTLGELYCMCLCTWLSMGNCQKRATEITHLCSGS